MYKYSAGCVIISAYYCKEGDAVFRLGFLLFILSTGFTPGPNNLASMANMAGRGFRKGLPFNLGLASGQAAALACAVFLCTTLNSVIPKIQTPMLIAGALYILWLAWNTWRSSVDIEESDRGGRFVNGLLICILNPKCWLYYITATATYIMPCFDGSMPEAVFMSLFLLGMGHLANLVWGLGGSALKTVFSEHRRLVNAVLALALVWCAVSLFL